MRKKLVIYDKSLKVPIKIWALKAEEECTNQAIRLASLPFIHKWVALMPDCHAGYGMPIGTVLPSKGYVIPNSVGVDIGCGMAFMELDVKASSINKEMFIDISNDIKSKIPVGVGVNRKDVITKTLLPSIPKNILSDSIIYKKINSMLLQLGTLGGGNHFIELQENKKGNLCIMVHTGSRGLGYAVGAHHNKIAKELNNKYFSSIPSNWDISFLPLDSNEGINYIKEMNYCVAYAEANRNIILHNIMLVLLDYFDSISVLHQLDVLHNYARYENHYGKNVFIHRKGAISARKDEYGIIPSCQGGESYIVKGLGNTESFMSASHGAGRVLSRTKARNTLNLNDEINKLNNKGVIHSIKDRANLDEASGAYKDIKDVMLNQSDLVTIDDIVKPILVIKG